MGENIKIGIQVSSDGSLPKVEKEASGVHEQLAKAAASSEKLNNNLKASKALQVAATKQPSMTGQEYGNARGTAALTGASARDFANQSQGLGGLVRLYATYAANVFAVSAAFGALKTAMDTTNMVAGLDQLGAATGRNLGSLSKRLVTLTDGAISFRDSMDAVAKTSSSGMASKDIERLAVVAKNASLALGVAMPDAINRLSRGISKLEPELLDELGIFTKIDPAVQAYARSMGKATSQLTDFERRQAFANAVLLEGEAKFGELATAAVNPYDRLLATLKNVSQEALSVVNGVLGPIVSLLASSPTALASALAVIGTLLVRQAIPALTEFKAGLAASAATATELAQRKAGDAKAARAQIDSLILSEVEARASKEIDAVDAAEAKIEKLRKAGYAKNSQAAKLLATDLDDIRQEDLAKQEKIAKGLETKAARIAKRAGADPEAIEAAKRNAEANRAVVDSITAAKKAQEDYFSVEKKVVTEREKAAKGASIYGLTIQAAKNAEDAATKKSIISNAAYNASLIGLSGSFRLLQADIIKSGLVLSAFEIKVLKARAAVGILVGALGAVGGAVNKILGAIGVLVTVISIFDSAFSSASKELEGFSSSLDKIDDAAANATRTLGFLEKKGGVAKGTIEGISSMANALNELTSSAEQAVFSANLAQQALKGYDKFKDSFASIFGGGIEKNLAEKLTKSVQSSLKILTASGSGQEFKQQIEKILNVGDLNLDDVEGAILGLADAAKTDLVQALIKANTALNDSSLRLQGFKAATDATTKSFQEFIQSTANNNPIFKLGGALENLGKSMFAITAGSIQEMDAAMVELARSPEKGMLFGQGFIDQLLAMKDGFLDQTEAVRIYQSQLERLDKQIAEARKEESVEQFQSPEEIGGRSVNFSAALEADRAKVAEVAKSLATDKIEAARSLFVTGMDGAFKKGSELIATGLGQAAEKAQQTIARALAGGLSGAASAIEETRIAKQDIQIQMRAVNVNIDLILSQERLRASIDEANAVTTLEIAKKDNKSSEQIASLERAVTAAKGFRQVLGAQDTAAPKLDSLSVAAASGIAPGTREFALLQQKTLGVSGQIGAQKATLTELGGSMAAANITGVRAVRAGKLEDQQKILDLNNQIKQVQLNRLSILSSISGLSTEQATLAQSELDKATLSGRQKQELLQIEAAILNAGKNALQLTNLNQQKELLVSKQRQESDTQSLQIRQKLLQIELDGINKRYELFRSTAELEKTVAQSNLDVKSQELAAAGALYGVSKEYLINQQSSLDLEKQRLESTTAMQAVEDAFGQKREEAQERINNIRLAGGIGALVEEQKLTEELNRQESLKNNSLAGLNAQFQSRKKIAEISRASSLAQEKLNKAIEDNNKQFELQRSSNDLQYTRANAMLDVRTQELNLYGALYGLSKTFMISAEATLATEKLTLENTRAREIAEAELSQKRKTSEEQIAALKLSTNTLSATEKLAAEKRINDEFARQVTLTANTLGQLEADFGARSQILKLTTKANLEQERYNQLMTTSTDLATSLASIFGQLGTSIGTVVTSITEMSIASEKSAKVIRGLEFSRDITDDPQEYKLIQAELDEQRNKSTKAELAGYSKIAGATKSLFKEKTGAYKVLAATEKAMQLAALFMDAKAFATKMGFLTAEVTATAAADSAIVGSKLATAPAKVAADVPGILSSFANMGPVGYAIGAALVASLLAMVGGGGGAKAAFVPTAEQRQETQGTAMGFDADGNKVQVRRGVFGDTDAKSESIANSLEIIKNNSVEGLAFDNKMLNALQSLNEALNSAAKGLFGIRGLRSGSLGGVVEGANTSGGLLGIGGLFSSSTSKSIIDSGLQLKGTFFDLAKGIQGTINTFETVSTTVKKSGFFGIGGSTRTNVATEFRDLAGIDPKAFKSLADTFNFAADLLYTTAETADVSADAVTQVLKSIKVDEMASLRGLTGESFAKELSAVIGAVLDDASLAIFSSFAEYANFGEGMLETVIRVTDTNKKINQAVINMDSKSPSLAKLVGVTETLAKAAGGLDEFLEQAQNFRTNFLSEAEQLVPVQKAVTIEMARLGFASVDTRDEFKTLVQGLDLTTVGGQQTYQSLMNVQQGFIQVTAAAQKEAEERKTLDKKLAQINASKDKLREMELETLFAGNRELQKEIWLKEDQTEATKALQASLQNTTKTIKSQITSLSDYKTALLGGASSTLTATEQYALAKTEVDGLTATINKSANTPEEVEARSSAVSKLSSATDKFLTMSRGLFASGSQYTVDFNSVLGIVSGVSQSLSNQLTDAEKQLGALETSNTYLQSISDTGKTTAQLLQTYLGLGGTPLVGASFAAGTNYVPQDMVAQIHRGERIIPVADNFKLMTNLSSTDNYSREMVAEIKALNQKISRLEQTVAQGAVINVDATNRNTEQIAQAVIAGSDKTVQANRLQAKAGIK